MGRAARGVAAATLAVIGVAAAGLGLVLGRPAEPTAGSSPPTETVGKGVVRKTVSDTGVIADRYTYSIRPEADPVLLAVHGKETEQASQSSGSGSTETATYTLDEVKVGPGERVSKGDLLAIVRNADDEKIDVEAPFAGNVRTVSSAKKAVLTEVATLGVGRSEVVVEVSQYDVVRLAEDKNVELSLDTDRTSFDGTIAEIAQSATSTDSGSAGAGSDAAVQTYQVIIRVSELPKSARVGMSVSSKITISSRDQVLSVPLTAVADQNGDSTVRLLRADGSVLVRPVTVGLVGDTRVEITKGLRAGDAVIIGEAGQGGQPPAAPFGGGPFDDDDTGTGGTAAEGTGR